MKAEHPDQSIGILLPLDLPSSEIRKIMSKHGIVVDVIEGQIIKASGGYLQQCLYRSQFGRSVRETLGLRPRQIWWNTRRPPPE